jgi:RNA polymerase sigma factor (sigma-70 family)
MSAATSGAFALDESEPASSRAGFVALYRSHASFTWACLRRLGVPLAAIDDAMQELWVTAHRRIESLHGPGSAKAWLYGIARRVASHHRRSEQRHRRKLDAIGDTARRHDEAERESELVVESILSQLDARVREAFVLSELEGWSAPEIARATGANTNTIYWRVRVARQELRSQLGDDEHAASARVIELRDATRAPRGTAKHCWMLIAPKLAAPSVLSSMFGTWSVVKAMVIATAVTLASATTIELGMRSDAAPRDEVAAIENTVARATPEPMPVVEPATVAVPALLLPTPQLAAPLAAPLAVATEPAPRSQPREQPAATPTQVAVQEAPAAMAAEDAKLLHDAQLSVAAGRLDDARVALAAHRDAFPDSKLGDLRDLIDVKLRCASGDADGARGLARAMVARAPDSAVASKLATTCAGLEP